MRERVLRVRSAWQCHVNSHYTNRAWGERGSYYYLPIRRYSKGQATNGAPQPHINQITHRLVFLGKLLSPAHLKSLALPVASRWPVVVVDKLPVLPSHQLSFASFASPPSPHSRISSDELGAARQNTEWRGPPLSRLEGLSCSWPNSRIPSVQFSRRCLVSKAVCLLEPAGGDLNFIVTLLCHCHASHTAICNCIVFL